MGEKGAPKLELDEIEEGFETVWVPLERVWLTLEGALSKVKGSSTAKYETKYMVPRDTAFLEEAINQG